MKTNFTKEVIMDRINQFNNRDFRVTAKDDIFYTKSENEAMNFFNSEKGVALVLYDEWSGSLLGSEMVIAYKEDDIPPDFFHLMYTRNIYNGIGELALENGQSFESFKLLHTDLNACCAFFSSFYRYCPELIDDSRLSIQKKITDLCGAQLFHNYELIAELCDEIVADINVILQNLNVTTDWIDLKNYKRKGN